MRSKGEVDRYVLWLMVCLILLIVLIALFYSAGIRLIRDIILKPFGGG